MKKSSNNKQKEEEEEVRNVKNSNEGNNDGQEKLSDSIDNLSEEQKEKYLDEIKSLDWEQLKKGLEEEKEKFNKKEEILKTHIASLVNQLEWEKKRTFEEIKSGNKKLLEQLLFFLDNFEQAVKMSQVREDCEQKVIVNFLEGFKMCVEEFQKILVSQGVEKIKVFPFKEQFDPEKHEVIKISENEEYPQNTVLKVLREGYFLNQKVLRSAWVELSKKKEENSSTIG